MGRNILTLAGMRGLFLLNIFGRYDITLQHSGITYTYFRRF